jgi:hypothetical protein
MKYVTLFLTLLIGTYSVGQDELPNCQGFSNSELLSVYKVHSNLLATGRKSNSSGQEAMLTIVYSLSQPAITQMCIDVWYDIDRNGDTYTYERFKTRYGYISKENYWRNRYKLEILSVIHQAIMKG